MRALLFLQLLCSFLSLSAYAVTPTTAELGTPIYVLDRAKDSSGSYAFSFWEIRPSEVNRRMLSGSRLLLKHEGVQAREFGLAGFRIDSYGIYPGSLILLDARGKLHRATLDLSDSEVRFGKGEVKALPGEYVALEQEAEDTIFAVTKSKQLVEINPAGEISETGFFVPLSSDQRILDIRRANPGELHLVTTSGVVFHWNIATKSVELKTVIDKGALQDARVFGFKVWTRAGDVLSVRDLLSGKSQSLDLSSHYQPEEGGDGFQFLGNQGDAVYARVGNHVMAFSPSKQGSGLTGRVLSDGFFSKKMRSFGVQYGLNGEILSLQPRQADRSGAVRSEFGYRDVKLAERPWWEDMLEKFRKRLVSIKSDKDKYPLSLFVSAPSSTGKSATTKRLHQKMFIFDDPDRHFNFHDLDHNVIKGGSNHADDYAPKHCEKLLGQAPSEAEFKKRMTKIFDDETVYEEIEEDDSWRR